MGTTATTVIILVAYMAIILIVGFVAGRKVKTGEDYALGGRDIPGWAAALSERATDCSAWLALGLPGSAYLVGLSSIWTAVGCVIGSAGAWFMISNQMRKDAEQYGALTFIDWISKRHSGQARKIQFFGGITIAFFFTIYVAAQFIGGGNTFNSLLGLEPIYGILITVAIVIPYTLYGGFSSVVYTDCIQAIMLLAMLIFVPIAGFIYMHNNPDMVFATSISQAFALANTAHGDLFAGAKGLGVGVVLGNGLAWCFAYLGGLPQLNVRFMSVRNEKNFKIGRIVSVSYIIISYIGAILIGLVALCVFGPGGLNNVDQATPMLAMTVMPSAVATLMITGVIAAMLSTADSLLVLASTEVAEDIVKPRLKGKDLTDKQYLKIARIVTFAIAILGFLMVFFVNGNFINTIVSWVWAGLGSPFAVCTLLTLYWKKYTDKAALWTIIVGLFFTIFWIVSGLDGVITSMFTGFIAALITGIVVSYITQPEAVIKE